jgi:hypothetical protein
MTRRSGFEVSEFAARRLTALRQYEKYEHTRADADAALAAGRWRLAGLSARASVGFALDVVAAGADEPYRDEVHRSAIAAAALASPADREELWRLLSGNFDAHTATDLLARCWRFVDEVLRIHTLDIPGYYGGDRRAEHERQRAAWLGLARIVRARTPFTDVATRQLLAGRPPPDGG